MKIRFKLDTYLHCCLIGYLDFTVSIKRQWGSENNWTSSPYWKHITIGFRSPLLWHWSPFKGFRWYRLRFGYGDGNLYLGPLYVVTTFASSRFGIEYRNVGPFEIAMPSAAN